MHFHPDTQQIRLASSLGPVRLAASPTGLCGLWFEGQRHEPAQLHGAGAWPIASPGQPLLSAAAAQLTEWLAGARRDFDLPLDLSGGTPFQQSVWRALLGIAWGQTRSYGEVAQLAGTPAAVRAVGAAVGRNPLSLVVPCHRVLGASGALTGYAGGLDRKRALLAMEAAAPVAPPARAAVRLAA
ncbi:MAG: methylated-DNA--[protein]-cysteine S-methyltransferase [Giesbergeria sp.]